MFDATRDNRLPAHQVKTLLAWGQGLAPGSKAEPDDWLGPGPGLASVKGQGLGIGQGLLADDKDKDKGVDTRESKLATIADPMARNLIWQVI